jgi:hypothetical protein
MLECELTPEKRVKLEFKIRFDPLNPPNPRSYNNKNTYLKTQIK